MAPNQPVKNDCGGAGGGLTKARGIELNLHTLEINRKAPPHAVYSIRLRAIQQVFNQQFGALDY